jgi:hypothetical protein
LETFKKLKTIVITIRISQIPIVGRDLLQFVWGIFEILGARYVNLFYSNIYISLLS